LNKRRNSFEVAAQNQPLLEKVRIALGHGLGQRALQLMLEADISQFKEQEIQKILELMLSQGRAEEVLAQMREEFRRFLGMNYDWYKAQAAAALGNYEEAFHALESAADHLESICMQSALQLSSSQITHGDNPEVITGQRTLLELRRQQADFIALAGIIALEQGDVARARDQFIRAIGLGDGHAFIFESKPIATRYLELINGAASTSSR
jgi:tetratricopeptide (TPR) repeat protein